MKVTLYMTTTVNGFIAKENNDTSWSKETWLSFAQFVKKTGNIIIGRKTYELMNADNEFRKIGNPFTVVVSKEIFIPPFNAVLAKSPKEALKIIKEKNFPNALVAGGAILSASFMKENLVDEVIIDIEPYIFGRGIRLFSKSSFEKRLKLIKTKKLSKNTIQLKYSKSSK